MSNQKVNNEWVNVLVEDDTLNFIHLTPTDFEEIPPTDIPKIFSKDKNEMVFISAKLITTPKNLHYIPKRN